MEPYSVPFENFAKLRKWPFAKVADDVALSKATGEEMVTELKHAEAEGRKFMVICPVGPLDFSHWADAMNRAQTDGSRLITVNMDEYLDDRGDLVPESHALSFRKFMKEELFNRLTGRARVPAENIHFPSPHEPAVVTRLIEQHGGADLCYAGIGLSGHLAFNDPPEPGEAANDGLVRNSRTRVVRICRESMAQMCLGGTGGNWEIIPPTAITLGMYELLLSKRVHLTFMRSWHAGVLRRALFGPVTWRYPASFVQQHPNVSVTVTEIAAAPPLLHVAQRVTA